MIKYKDIFKTTLKDNYTINFDKKNDDIIIINDTIKCKYTLLFNCKKISKNLYLIIWNDSNIYSHEPSKLISKNIREFFFKEKKYLLDQNNQLIFTNDLENLIESIIKNDKKINNIETIWIISNNDNKDLIKQYYLITEIINF